MLGFSVGGMTTLELKKQYQDLTGNVNGTPAYDPLAKETIGGPWQGLAKRPAVLGNALPSDRRSLASPKKRKN